jgi:flagellar hook-associated protein 1 FlgK
MPGFFGMLSSTANSLEAQRYALDVVGQNIANVNTPGYTRRVVDLADIAPNDPQSAGGGVEALGMRSVRDRFLDRRLWQETPAAAQHKVTADTLGLTEIAIGAPGRGLDAKLGQFFDSVAALADAPASASVRQQVVTNAQTLVSEFHGTADRLGEVARDADQQIRGAVEDVNRIAKQIAELNGQIGNATPSALPHLVDEQRRLVGELSGLLEIQTIERQEGGLDVTFGRGRPLALSNVAYAIDIVSLSPSGYADLQSGGVSVTAEVSGGKIGGWTAVRDTNVPAYLTQLDTLAHSVAQQVNALHATGFDLNGAAGGNFFTPLGTSVGAARAIAVDATVAGDPARIAAAGVAAPGDNQVARSISRLRDTRVLAGGTATFSEAWGQLVYRVGADSAGAKASAANQDEIVRQVEAMRDNVSGVSIDEEAAMMLRFQRAYEANARFFSAVDQSLAVLLNLGRS